MFLGAAPAAAIWRTYRPRRSAQGYGNGPRTDRYASSTTHDGAGVKFLRQFSSGGVLCSSSLAGERRPPPFHVRHGTAHVLVGACECARRPVGLNGRPEV